MPDTLMRAAVLTGVGRLEIAEVPLREPGPGEVLVRVRAVGLCGTDFHIFAGHGNYNTDARGVPVPLSVQPQILGHEVVGDVEALGPGVQTPRRGDRVIVDQGISCVSSGREPRCEYCATGDSHQCAFYQEHGITGLPGGLAEFITVPAVNTVSMRAGTPYDRAVLAEPLGCIVHASDAVARVTARYTIDHPEPGRRVRTVFISGAGPAGLLFTQYLRQAIGFDGLILVSEPNPLKRALAARFGAEPLDPAADPVDAVIDRTEGRRVEYVIDASGAGTLFRQVPGLLRKQGTILLYGHGHAGQELTALNNVQFLEPAFVSPCGASGAFLEDGRPATYKRALDLVESGRIVVDPIVTHRYTSLAEVPAAFAGAHQAHDYVKGVVQFERRGG